MRIPLSDGSPGHWPHGIASVQLGFLNTLQLQLRSRRFHRTPRFCGSITVEPPEVPPAAANGMAICSLHRHKIALLSASWPAGRGAERPVPSGKPVAGRAAAPQNKIGGALRALRQPAAAAPPAGIAASSSRSNSRRSSCSEPPRRSATFQHCMAVPRYCAVLPLVLGLHQHVLVLLGRLLPAQVLLHAAHLCAWERGRGREQQWRGWWWWRPSMPAARSAALWHATTRYTQCLDYRQCPERTCSPRKESRWSRYV